MLQRLCSLAVLGLIVVPLAGCLPELYPDTTPATLREINRIRNDTSLTAQQKRTALEALGITPLTINGLLRSERTANQFGGTLRTAYNKVVEPDLRKLTPDEVQLYGDGASEVSSTINVAFTDTAALAIVEFLRAEDLQTPTELAAFLDDSNNTVPARVDIANLRAVFVNFTPTDILPILP